MLTVFNVNSTLDTVDAYPGDGLALDAQGRTTLRAAIMEANTTVEADTITVPSGTYQLTISGVNEKYARTGDLDIRNDVTIVGAGAATTVIDASQLVERERVFDVLAGTATDLRSVELRGLTITGGVASQLIYSDTHDAGAGASFGAFTDVTIADTVWRDNSAFRDLRGLAYGSGGAVYAAGKLTVLDSRFERNTAGEGGGYLY